MLYSIVASALLGAGAALAPVDTGLTCQLPPNELLISAEQCDGSLLDAKTVLACYADWDVSRGGLMSLSEDAAACSLAGFEPLEAQNFHMDACAKVMGDLTPIHDVDQTAMPTRQQAAIEIVTQPLKAVTNHHQVHIGQIASDTGLYPLARSQQPRAASPREHADATLIKLPARNNIDPARTNDATQGKQTAATAPSLRATTDLFSATASLIPSAPGSRHFAGMACALAIVSLIFVVWM
ncbi:hypothetical protein ACHAQA_003477 [Verticillium albo-atrum]